MNYFCTYDFTGIINNECIVIRRWLKMFIMRWKKKQKWIRNNFFFLVKDPGENISLVKSDEIFQWFRHF